MLGQSLNLETLMEFRTDLISLYPHMERKTVCSIKYPTPCRPDGWEVVTRELVEDYWGIVTLQSIIDDARARKLTNEDKDKRRFLFVVAVNMRRSKAHTHVCRNVAASNVRSPHVVLATPRADGAN